MHRLTMRPVILCKDAWKAECFGGKLHSKSSIGSLYQMALNLVVMTVHLHTVGFVASNGHDHNNPPHDRPAKEQ